MDAMNYLEVGVYGAIAVLLISLTIFMFKKKADNTIKELLGVLASEQLCYKAGRFKTKSHTEVLKSLEEGGIISMDEKGDFTFKKKKWKQVYDTLLAEGLCEHETDE